MLANHCVKKFCLGLILVLIGTTPAFAIVSATATMTAVPDGVNYDYTITLNNTGPSGIETFWFAWLPGYDLLTSNPTVTKTPSNWTTFIESGNYGGYSIEFYDQGTSSALASGQSSSEFQFTSPDTPNDLAGYDTTYGYYRQTESYVYQGAAEASFSSVISNIPITTVPEPSSSILAGLAGLASLVAWHQRKSR
jgi:hypothetical protein